MARRGDSVGRGHHPRQSASRNRKQFACRTGLPALQLGPDAVLQARFWVGLSTWAKRPARVLRKRYCCGLRFVLGIPRRDISERQNLWAFLQFQRRKIRCHRVGVSSSSSARIGNPRLPGRPRLPTRQNLQPRPRLYRSGPGERLLARSVDSWGSR